MAAVASGTSSGDVFTLLYPNPPDNGMSRILAHKGPVSRVMVTQDARLLFSTGEDGTVWIYQVEEEKIGGLGETQAANQEMMHGFGVGSSNAATTSAGERDQNGSPNRRGAAEEEGTQNSQIGQVMDAELASIVLVRKAEMDAWLSRQAHLKSELESTKRKVDAKLEQHKKAYEAEFEERKRQKEIDI